MPTDENDEVLEAAERLRQDLAGIRLSPVFARLYSQHTRLAYIQPGLVSWDATETRARMHDAMRLTAAALTERQQNVEGWQQSLRRAGEILEWLSHPELNPQGLPLIFLAGAAYQLAGLPARSTGLLTQASLSDEVSQIIHSFLRADFRTVLNHLCNFWRQNDILVEPLPWSDDQLLSEIVQDWITNETASAIGVLCAFLRWGDETRMQVAVQKLSAVAGVFLNGRDSYSWLLAKLLANVAGVYSETSLRANLSEIFTPQDGVARRALDAYQRFSYISSKALTWPSQSAGIRRLGTRESFALCTPTGSGKTTIAEIAILQSLFDPAWNPFHLDLFLGETPKPLVLYLVPTRALAAEVESKLHNVLVNLVDEPVRVTGLYGGIDWGPTDAWLTMDDRTVLICTYEKAEALLRFVGPFFLYRVSLVIIDEAHQVQYYGEAGSLDPSDSRQLRLESLSARLLSHISQETSRVIALSAVSTGFENSISDWITGSVGSMAVRTSYRSTRQLIGRLEYTRDRRMTIFYDLMDGAHLRFRDGRRTDTPYIPDPFPQYPIAPRWDNKGPEKRIRPYLFWAAIHLAGLEQGNSGRSVLVAIAQQLGGYAEDLLVLLRRDWSQIDLPRFFELPSDARKYRLWQECLAACEDYFTQDSREYELLERGVVLHHGKMPGILARLLVELINERVVNLVLATSTLSEGVNLPFCTILVPKLHRAQAPINVSEFQNLVGRAGRPGIGTEGRTLVVMANRNDYGATRVRTRYQQLLSEISEVTDEQTSPFGSSAQSALASLLSQIERLWTAVSGLESRETFLAWLEQVAPVQAATPHLGSQDEFLLIESVDTLDEFLLSAIVELEQLSQHTTDPTSLEDALQRIWQRTYARVATHDATALQTIFVRRGMALRSTVYPDEKHRRRLYKTSLPPRDATQLLSLYPTLLPHLRSGADYINWSAAEKYEFIRHIVVNLAVVRPFNLAAGVGNTPWTSILRWWLDPQHASSQPRRTRVSDWHKYVSNNFQYRFNWGLGSLIALTLDDLYQGELRLPTVSDWPQTGLPWIVFWLKELMTWGTLDPVAALLLSRRIRIVRRTAEEAAQEYYRSKASSEPNDILDPVSIMRWIQETQLNRSAEGHREKRLHHISVELLRDFGVHISRQFRVLPVERDGHLKWYDPAGFPLAQSVIIEQWTENLVHEYDFFLDPYTRVVTSQLYLS